MPHPFQTPGDRIRVARLALPRAHKGRPVSQRKIGERLGWHAAQERIYALENSKRPLTVQTCELLAKALNVTPEWLAFGVGDGPARDREPIKRPNVDSFHDLGGNSRAFDIGAGR